MSVTWVVSKFSKTTFTKLVQPWKSAFIFLTLLVERPLRFTSVKDSHPANIFSIVFKLFDGFPSTNFTLFKL